MPRLSEQNHQEILRFIEGDTPVPDRFQFLLCKANIVREGANINLQSVIYFIERQMRTEYLQV